MNLLHFLIMLQFFNDDLFTHCNLERKNISVILKTFQDILRRPLVIHFKISAISQLLSTLGFLILKPFRESVSLKGRVEEVT